MTPPFKPLGDIARWRIIYNLLTVRQVDDILTYDEMGDALNLDPVKDRRIIQGAMPRASKEFEESDKHALTAVPNIGYRIVEPEEHLRLAKDQQRRSSRALVSGRSKVVNVDLSEVAPEVRQAFQVVASAFAMQMEFNRRTDIRQKKLEQSLDAIRDKTTRTDNEVAELRDRLKRLEERDEES